MDFTLTEDHLALRDAVQRFCEGEFPAQHRGNPETPEQSRQRWQAMAELGLLGLPMAPEFGGSGQGSVEVMLVAQALGQALGGGAWLASTVMAGQLLHALGTPAQQQRWLPSLASGQMQGALALQEEGMRYQWQRCAAQAVRQGDGYSLNGRKTLVLQGDSAQCLLVLARTSGQPGDREGLSVFALDAHTPGLQVNSFDTLDGRRAAHLEMAQVQVLADRLLGAEGQAADALEAVLDATTAALCGEAAGAAEALVTLTAEHLRTRRQFGSPLSRFQVLQHRLADMVIGLEQLKSMACAAAAAVADTDVAQRRRVVSAAKVLAGQLGRQIGWSAIQLHGGMGMTDESRVGHYVKRLMVIGQLQGDASWHLQRLRGGPGD